MNTILYFHTLQSVHLSPPLFSLTISKNNSKKKQAQTSHKKVFQRKTSACRNGTLKNQPNKMGTTPQHIHTIPTPCAILPTIHNKKLFTHSLNEHSTQHCSLHSLPHKRQSISATFISNKILQHMYLKLPTYHMTHHCSQFLHTRQTIPAMLSSNYIAATHNTTHSTAHQHAQHTAIPSPLPSSTLLCTHLTNTKHSWQNGTRCRDGVNVLWCRSHLVQLVFERSHPYMCLFSFGKLFCDLYYLMCVMLLCINCLGMVSRPWTTGDGQGYSNCQGHSDMGGP